MPCLAAGDARRGPAPIRCPPETTKCAIWDMKTGCCGWSGRIVPVVVYRLRQRVMLRAVGLRGNAPVDASEAPEPWTVPPEFQKNASSVAHTLARDVNQITHDACEPPPLDLEPDRKCLRATQRLLPKRAQKVEATKQSKNAHSQKTTARAAYSLTRSCAWEVQGRGV